MEAKEIQKLLELAENREEIGDHEGAKKSYAAALELARSSQNEQLNLICGYNFGTALVNTGEPRKGVEILLKMLRLGKNIRVWQIPRIREFELAGARQNYLRAFSGLSVARALSCRALSLPELIARTWESQSSFFLLIN